MHLFADNEATLDRACKDIGVTRDRFDQDVLLVKQWLDQQPHLPAAPEQSLFCENLLLRCKGSVEMTKKAIDCNFTVRSTYPDFFGVRDPLGEDIQHLLDIWINAPLPQLTAEGHRVKIYVISTPEDVCTHEMDTVVKLWMMQSDLEMKEDVNLGEVFVHDLVHLSMAHIVRFTPTLLQNAMDVGANGCKARIKAVHLLNAPPMVDALVRLLKAVLPKKLAARVYVHSSLEALHQHVDRDVLPKDYGGRQKPLAELALEWRGKLESHREWFLEQDFLGKVDETKRPPSATPNKGNCFGVEGTFKKLQVD